MNTSLSLPHIGHQRDWVWRGWQTRYAFSRPENINNQHRKKSFSDLQLLLKIYCNEGLSGYTVYLAF